MNPGVQVRIGTTTRRVVAAGAGVLISALVLAGCSTAPRVAIDLPEQVAGALPAATGEQLQSAVESAMTASGATGAVVGVWAPWSGEWTAGIGTVSAESADPVTPDMTFRVGQVTRAMTCVALDRLAAEGTVSLDDSITAYVPSVPTLSEVTLRDLCDSTSGVGSYGDTLRAGWLQNGTRTWDPRELASFGIASADLSAVGTTYRDSDAGYVLLGLALERASGRSAAATLSQEVFTPLGLDRTALPTAAASAPVVRGSTALPGHAIGAGCTAPVDATVASASTGFTDAGVVSDLADLATFTRALATGALTPGRVNADDGGFVPFDGAPAWLRTDGGALRAGSMIGQFGVVHGYSTAAFSDPTTGLTVVVALNASGADLRIAPYLAWELAAVASKSPAAAGRSLPEAGLPWSAAQFHDEIGQRALCPAP